MVGNKILDDDEETHKSISPEIIEEQKRRGEYKDKILSMAPENFKALFRTIEAQQLKIKDIALKTFLDYFTASEVGYLLIGIQNREKGIILNVNKHFQKLLTDENINKNENIEGFLNYLPLNKLVHPDYINGAVDYSVEKKGNGNWGELEETAKYGCKGLIKKENFNLTFIINNTKDALSFGITKLLIPIPFEGKDKKTEYKFNKETHMQVIGFSKAVFKDEKGSGFNYEKPVYTIAGFCKPL